MSRFIPRSSGRFKTYYTGWTDGWLCNKIVRRDIVDVEGDEEVSIKWYIERKNKWVVADDNERKFLEEQHQRWEEERTHIGEWDYEVLRKLLIEAIECTSLYLDASLYITGEMEEKAPILKRARTLTGAFLDSINKLNQ